MTTDLEQELVTDDQLSRYAKLIYEKTGIAISPQKKTLLSNRLKRRLRKTGIAGYDAYLLHLKKLKATDAEWDFFLQEITTHETYLFRDESHWQWFQSSFLLEIVADSRQGQRDRSLRILSAACSTGDEAFTIATCIAAALPTVSQWNIEIVGTDIGVGALEQARSAVFGERSMRLVPDDYRKRFFAKAADANVWQAKPVLTHMIAFRQHNLMEPLREKPFDLVLLKNVLIYFDKQSKAVVLEHLRNVLRSGGLLVSGAAEGVSDLLPDFQRVQPWLFRKPQ
jgi:chemotaxis protein methyltransferase CheR